MRTSARVPSLVRLACRLVGVLALASMVLAALVGPGPYVSSARAQDELAGTPAELAAFEAAGEEKWVRARELATRLVRSNPSSYVGHFVLALAQHEGEANFPVAQREAELALAAYTRAYGDPPRYGSPWRWHAMMLRELADIQGDLEQHAARLSTIDEFNRLYSPRLVAERAWSLMKLRRFDEARRAATEGTASGDPGQIEMALNALCAIEFEAGRDGRSYDACRAALDYGRQSFGGPAVVDLTNFAEAARTELKLAESEQALREATDMMDGGYGNPWLEMGELFVREGRMSEALDALRRVPAVRQSRIPSMRDSDRNESMRALASFYLVAGRTEDALRITQRAIVMPDRRGHNSRDPAQDKAIVALLDRAARRMRAGALLEEAAGGPWLASIGARARSAKLRFEAWQSGRQVVDWLRDRARLVGILQIGLSTGGITPPWLVADLGEVIGAGAMRRAVSEARRGDRRALARGYYDAMEAETWLASGDEDRAITLARRALSRVPSNEGLLVARTHVVLGRALLEKGDARRAGAEFESALAADPSVLRRLDVALPARIRATGGALSNTVVDRLEASGRFDDDGASFTLDVQVGANGGRICLRGPTRVFGCADVARRARASDDAFAASAVRVVFATLFAPPLGIGPRDVSALEGPTRTAHRPLDTIFDRRVLDVPVDP